MRIEDIIKNGEASVIEASNDQELKEICAMLSEKNENYANVLYYLNKEGISTYAGCIGHDDFNQNGYIAMKVENEDGLKNLINSLEISNLPIKIEFSSHEDYDNSFIIRFPKEVREQVYQAIINTNLSKKPLETRNTNLLDFYQLSYENMIFLKLRIDVMFPNGEIEYTLIEEKNSRNICYTSYINTMKIINKLLNDFIARKNKEQSLSELQSFISTLPVVEYGGFSESIDILGNMYVLFDKIKYIFGQKNNLNLEYDVDNVRDIDLEKIVYDKKDNFLFGRLYNSMTLLIERYRENIFTDDFMKEVESKKY